MENQKFDALRDVAYAEIYTTVLRMENEKKIDTDLDTEIAVLCVLEAGE